MSVPSELCPIEIAHSDHPRGPFRCVVFDFDGTLSLLRADWQGLMIPMMVEALAGTGTGESLSELTAIVEEFVTRLTGQPTMRQMEALAAEIVRRGGPTPDPQIYLDRYLDQLLGRTAERISAVQSGRMQREELLIPGSLPLLETLRARGTLLAVASGTELAHVDREARLLGIDHFFGEGIFGPEHNNATFSKAAVMRQLLAKHSLRGNELVAIGDGPAEILAAKSLGALAIGVASDEVHGDGRINPLKREHLLRAGADVIVADYRDLDMLRRRIGFA
jgi:phosphoglycolate phosphatase